MIRFILLVFILSTVSVSSIAQQYRLPLWHTGKVPNSQKTTDREKWDSTDIVRISLVQDPDILVFLPAKKNATGQAVVICPGGGYGILAYDWEGTDVAKWLNSKGVAAIVLKYRLPNPRSSIVPHKTPLLDAQRAIRMVRSHATAWNIKNDKVGIMGFSAGGHLASTAATRFDNGNANAQDSIDRMSSRPDFAILIYPVIKMSAPATHSGSRNNLIGTTPGDELITYYSNDLQVTKETPQTFIVHASDDTAVPVENSLAFYLALKTNKIPAEMHLYPYGGHGFGLAVGKGYLETWPERCADWLRSINK
jgi:acetyl esterase/lipase